LSNVKVTAISAELKSSPEAIGKHLFFYGFGNPILSSFEAGGSEGEDSMLPLHSRLKKKSAMVRSAH